MIKVKPHSCVEQLIVSDLVVCGFSYHTRAALSCDMKPHKQTRSGWLMLDLIFSKD